MPLLLILPQHLASTHYHKNHLLAELWQWILAFQWNSEKIKKENESENTCYYTGMITTTGNFFGNWQI